MDFQKAYDSVPRPLLWQVMRGIGPAVFLRAVQAMYADVTRMMNIEGCLGEAFAHCKGVKQGCPLIPTLFELFIDRFHFMVNNWAQGQVGPQLRSGRRVPLFDVCPHALS